MPPTRPIATMTLLAAVLGAGLSGCAATDPQPPTITEPAESAAATEFGDLAAAVIAAVPRITDVTDPARSQNGLGERLQLTLLVDRPDPLDAEELDAAVEAIWRTLPWEPNAIALVAGVGTEGDAEPVDLRTAAAELAPMGHTDAGQGGVSFVDMAERYGAWTAPE
ncbi:hypothetical protein [Microbacterium radiodurans]|uniref:TPM domain-containing protein n=1 Tax=Microbacterium radiodurans TaxID=661398 RepID=A0A5J5IPQ7_9MICO|nr:hypothetical protein [Microbacterium radiodurans]KAA9085406.1 hypothetical protein F6B42_13145 [Microbacterium radiodurans]